MQTNNQMNGNLHADATIIIPGRQQSIFITDLMLSQKVTPPRSHSLALSHIIA